MMHYSKEENIKQGIEKTIEEIVMNMMKIGCSMEEICKLTNLSKERVIQLKKFLE